MSAVQFAECRLLNAIDWYALPGMLIDSVLFCYWMPFALYTVHTRLKITSRRIFSLGILYPDFLSKSMEYIGFVYPFLRIKTYPRKAADAQIHRYEGAPKNIAINRHEQSVNLSLKCRRKLPYFKLPYILYNGRCKNDSAKSRPCKKSCVFLLKASLWSLPFPRPAAEFTPKPTCWRIIMP